MSEVEFNSFYILWSLFVSYCTTYFFYKRNKNLKKSFALAMSIFLILTGGAALYSYNKLSMIAERVKNNDVSVATGSIKNLENFNGMDSFMIDNTKFEIDHNEIHCLSVQKLLEENMNVTIKFVKTGLFRKEGGQCIIDIEYSRS
ncbi:hypothetical protein [Marinomonas sp. PE14-40]|uniref:hypothetical protein n=1 Tax=Marinomonas sp. PE14-40 TaxID=3060621 RepID=UPI003F666C81